MLVPRSFLALPCQAGVDGDPAAIVSSLIRSDTALAFNISRGESLPGGAALPADAAGAPRACRPGGVCPVKLHQLLILPAEEWSVRLTSACRCLLHLLASPCCFQPPHGPCCSRPPPDDVQVVAMRQVARRTLSANVTAMLGVDVPPGATGGLHSRWQCLRAQPCKPGPWREQRGGTWFLPCSSPSRLARQLVQMSVQQLQVARPAPPPCRGGDCGGSGGGASVRRQAHRDAVRGPRPLLWAHNPGG